MSQADDNSVGKCSRPGFSKHDRGKGLQMGRGITFVVSFALVTGCSTTVRTTEEFTVSTSSTSTTTTIPVSNLEILIDPASPDRDNANVIVESLTAMERDFPVEPGTVVILYSKTESSIAWALDVVREKNCFETTTAAELSGMLGIGSECGLLMRLDKEPSCDELELCKTRPVVAAHEFFHVVQHQTLLAGESLFFRNWLNEGAADYVGYAYAYGETPGALSPAQIELFRSNLKELAQHPKLEGDLNRMQVLFNYDPSQGPLERWYAYLYNRAFLAVTLLVEKFGKDAVLFDYVRRTAETRDYEKAFKLTFGVSQDEFSTEFESWLQGL